MALSIARQNISNITDCLIYPRDNLAFRAETPTWIDITISVFVIGKYRSLETALNGHHRRPVGRE